MLKCWLLISSPSATDCATAALSARACRTALCAARQSTADTAACSVCVQMPKRTSDGKLCDAQVAESTPRRRAAAIEKARFAARMAAALPPPGWRLAAQQLAPRVDVYPDSIICRWKRDDGYAAAPLFMDLLPLWLIDEGARSTEMAIVLDRNHAPQRLGAPSRAMTDNGMGEQLGLYPLRAFKAGELIMHFEGELKGTYHEGGQQYGAAVARLLAGRQHSHLLSTSAPNGRVALLDGAVSRPGGVQLCNDPRGVSGAVANARRGCIDDGDDLALYAARRLEPLEWDTHEAHAACTEIMWSYGAAFWAK